MKVESIREVRDRIDAQREAARCVACGKGFGVGVPLLMKGRRWVHQLCAEATGGDWLLEEDEE